MSEPSEVTSVNGVRIRLTDERWEHVAAEHSELEDMRALVLETVASPDRVLEGGAEELLAVREVEEGKWLVAVYREFEEDGFIITAFLTRKRKSLDKRTVIWPR